MLWIIIPAAVLFGAGLTGRIWKRGPKFWATWWRVTSLYLMVGGLALLTILPDWDWHGLLWLEVPTIGGFCLATYFMQKRARKRNKTAAEREFTKLSKEEIEELYKDDKEGREDYKERLRRFRKEVRKVSKWTKSQIIIVWGAAFTAVFIYAIRLGFKINVDGEYNPTIWWSLLIVVGVTGLGIALRLVRLKRWYITYPAFVGPALVALGIALWLAIAHLTAVADEVQWVPGEGGADSDVVATTAIDNCPTAFRLDNDNKGDGDGEIDLVPEELLNASADPNDMEAQAARAARDPEFLIQKAEEAGIWEEGVHSVEMITTSPDETNSNVNWCLSDYDAWIALAQLYPDTVDDWPSYVEDELNLQVEEGLLSPKGRDELVDQLN